MTAKWDALDIALLETMIHQGKSSREIAEALGVRTILEGSVRRAGNRIRVTAQLIDAAGGYHLWSERYDRNLADVFTMQDEIAMAIVGALRLKLAIDAPRHYTPKLPAYEAFLRGRHHFLKYTAEALARSQQYYEHAAALDATYGDPHLALAASYLHLAVEGVRPAREVMPLVRKEAAKALDLDPSFRAAQVVFLSLALDKGVERSGLDQPFGVRRAVRRQTGRICLMRRSTVGEVRLPLWRTFSNCDSSVFLTVPDWVAKNTQVSAPNSLNGSMATICSPSWRSSTLTTARPLAVREPSGSSNTFL